MTKLFDIMDNLPIVRILQVFAVLLFVLSIMSHVVSSAYLFQNNQFSGAPIDIAWSNLLTGLYVFLNGIVLSIYKPIILVALAEIIKLMKEKKNDKN